MERETDKHSPRVDDAMAHDVESLLKGAPIESRAQESRLQEDPEVGPGRRFDAEPAGKGISASEADRRADLSRHLAAVKFPAGTDDLVAAARDATAPDDVVSALGLLPEDQTFDNVQAVWLAMGGAVEGPHT
jgi:hypothetical protein